MSNGMSNLFERLACAPALRRPAITIVFWCLLCAASLFFLSRARIVNDFSVWFNNSNHVYRAYLDRNKTFGSDAYLAIAYADTGLFTPKGIGRNIALINAMRAIRGVQSATGLATVPVVLLSGTSMAPLGSTPGLSGPALRQIRDEMAASEYYRHHILSSDAQKTVIIVEPASYSARDFVRLVKKVQAILGSQFAGMRFYLSGSVYIEAEYNRLSARESAVFALCCGVLIFAACLLYFRTFSAALVPLSCAAASALVSMGLFTAAGNPVTAVTIIMPLVIMIVATATSMHIVHELINCGPFSASWLVSLRGLMLPGLLTSATTAIGFLSFVTCSVKPLWEMGLFTACGVMIAYAICFTLGPALMRLGPATVKHPFNWQHHRIVPFSLRYRWHIRITIAAGVAVMCAGMLRLHTETDQIRQLRNGNPVRVAIDTMQVWFEGIYPVDVVLRGANGKRLDMDRLIAPLSAFEKRLRQDSRIVKVLSPLDIERLAQSPQMMLAPLVRDSLYSMATAGRGGGLFSVYSEDGSACRVHLWTRWLTNVQTQALADSLSRWAAAYGLSPACAVSITGVSPMYAELDRMLLQGQISSIALSFLLVFFVFLFQTRSFAISGVALLPSLMPVFGTMGILGWAGIPLDVATVIIASITLGMSVDDVIHFIHGCKGDFSEQSMQRAMNQKGPALISTSLFISAGFMLLAPSSFVPLSRFGVFVALNVIIAMFTELTLAPGLFHAIYKRKAGRGAA
jgi:uncharacterized protein